MTISTPPTGTLGNVTAGRTEVQRLYVARAVPERTLGLLARPQLKPGEGLWIVPCGSIHTWGMRYAIDVLFLDRELRVLRITRGLQPWKAGWAPPGTRSVVELPAGGAEGVAVGDQLQVTESATGNT